MTAISGNAWLLSMHLLAASAVVGAITLYTMAFVAARRLDDVRQARALSRVVALGSVAFAAGAAGTLVFGIWLAFSVSGYSITDGWIIAAIVLWAVIGALSGRATAAYWRTTRSLAGGTDGVAVGPGETEQDVLASYRGRILLGFDLAAAAAAIAMLAVMIWKPGA